jgi:hypothetical protein
VRELMPSWANRNAPLIIVQMMALIVCAVAGAAVTEWQILPIQLPRTALLALVLLTVMLPILLKSWRISLMAFFAWLVLEDLVRKLAGNDIAIYFIKDAFYVVLLAAMVLDPAVRGSWRSATGSTRLVLYSMLGWAVVMSIPPLLVDWRLPLAGLRLDFLYVPLVAAGFMLVSDRAKLRRALVALSIVGGVSCAIGCIQAVVGPSFLAPDVATPGLNLDLVRGLPGQASVYRPTGTFVDPGRFDSMALAALAICLISLAAVRAAARLVVATCLVASILAIWVSGGRTFLIWGAALVAATVLPSVARGAAGAQTRRRWALAAMAGVIGVALVALVAPDVYGGRVSWYASTLDPRSTDNEWQFRWSSYSVDVVRSLQLGGVIGQGTGQESLGKQYLSGGQDAGGVALYQVEGGYAAVIVEWGVIGVLLWLAWTVAWMVRQIRTVRATRDGPLPSVGPVVVVWTAFFLFIGFIVGYQIFQNYVANAYFWLLSGLLFGAAALAKEKPPSGQENPGLGA